jgi:hypothetical protein
MVGSDVGTVLMTGVATNTRKQGYRGAEAPHVQKKEGREKEFEAESDALQRPWYAQLKRSHRRYCR